MKPKRSDVLAVLRHLASQGGKARAAKVSAERLSEIGRMGAAATWRGKRSKSSAKRRAYMVKWMRAYRRRQKKGGRG